MNTYWITFEDNSSGCCQGDSEYDAKKIAKHFKKKEIKDIKPLPYPASPVIWQLDHPVFGKTPTFCHDPRGCSGKSSCPKSYSCTE